jgi:hypothetical protein
VRKKRRTWSFNKYYKPDKPILDEFGRPIPIWGKIEHQGMTRIVEAYSPEAFLRKFRMAFDDLLSATQVVSKKSSA